MTTGRVELSLKYIFSAVAFSVLTACFPVSPSQPSADLVLKNVDLFDSLSGEVLSKHSVFISDGIITDIAPSQESDIAVEVVEGHGRLLTPGFIDTHIHSRHQFIYPRQIDDADDVRLANQFLPYGVTTVAEMGQPPAWIPQLIAWQNERVSDRPDVILVAGSLGSRQEWDTSPPPHHVLVDSVEAAREQVRAYHAQGATRLKLYWKLDLDDLAAAADEAQSHGIVSFAHVDNGIVGVDEAMKEGVRHFEHFFTLSRTIEEPDILIPLIREQTELLDIQSLDEWTLSLSLYHDMIERTPELKAAFDALLDEMAANQASISTALNVLAANAGRSPAYSGFDPYPPRLEGNIREDFVARDRIDQAFDSVLAQVKRAHERGVNLRIGTDASNGGAALRAELALLSEAGLPVADILQIATRNGAQSLGIDQHAGRIAVGRSADLILWEESPFDDAGNFLNAGVTTFKQGQAFVPSQTLSALASAVEGRDWDAIVAFGDDPALHPTDIFDLLMTALTNEQVEALVPLTGLIRTRLKGETLSDYIEEDSMTQIGSGLLASREPADVLPLFELIASIYTNSASAQANAGFLYDMTGNESEARTAFMRALSLDPELQAARDALERVGSE